MIKYIILNTIIIKWQFYIGMEANVFEELCPSTEGRISIKAKQPSTGTAPNTDCLIDWSLPFINESIYQALLHALEATGGTQDIKNLIPTCEVLSI